MIWKLRVLLFYFLVSITITIFFVIFSIPFAFFNINYHFKYTIASKFSHIFIWLGRITCGLQYNVEGLNKLPNEPCIVLANHQSFWDNIFMPIIIPKHSWIIKRELFKIPIFGWCLKLVNPIAVDRSNSISVKQILREGQKKIQDGLWLIIFPEATRVHPGQNVRFKPSAVKLAQMNKVPIVLIAHNAGIYWPKGFWIKQPGTIQVKILDVINITQISKDDVRELTDDIEQKINTAKNEL